VSSRNWQRRIEDILDAIAEIQSFSAGATLEQFKTDVKTLRAVAADLIIIGEAANHIPDDVQNAHKDVPWVLMRAMRNRVVRVYFDVDPDILWDTVHNDLPKLIDPLNLIVLCQIQLFVLSDPIFRTCTFCSKLVR
jgi:uncharacterized protein with HEPN domain